MFLQCHTYYSLRYGILSIERLLKEAQQKNITSLVLTDINNTSGWFELLKESKKYNIDVKAGIDFRNGNTHLYTGIAKNEDGFAELNRFLSGYLKAKPDLPLTAPAFEHAFIIYPYQQHKQYHLKENEFIGVAKHDLHKFRFDNNKVAKEKYVALNAVTFACRKDFNAHRILRAMDNKSIITKLTAQDIAGEHEQFNTYDGLIEAFGEQAFLLHNAQKLIDDCSFDFSFGTNKNIQTFTGNEQDDINLLLQLTYEGVPKRFGKLRKDIQDRINKELEIIIQKGFVAYYLINWDIIRYAKSMGSI